MNTAVSAIMELLNAASDFQNREAGNPDVSVFSFALQTIVQLLNPFAPHISEELWSRLGQTDLLTEHPWPAFDPDLAREEEATVVIQVNGKMRGTVLMPRGSTVEQVLEAASADPKIQKHFEGKKIGKFVQDKLLNLVVP